MRSDSELRLGVREMPEEILQGHFICRINDNSIQWRLHKLDYRQALQLAQVMQSIDKNVSNLQKACSQPPSTTVHGLCSWRSLLISSQQSTWNPAAFCTVSSQTRTFKYILSTQRDLFLPDKHGECALVDPRKKSSDLPLVLLLLAVFLMHMRIIERLRSRVC